MQPADIADTVRRQRRLELAQSEQRHPDDPGAPEPNDDDADKPVLADDVLNRSALRRLPDPQPLIDDVLDQGTTALLYGRWGTAKSFIALDWAASVATGRKWQNRHTERRRVLYVAAEGAFGFKARVDAWEAGWQTTINDADLGILPHPVNLTHHGQVRELAALIDWGGYSFVVLDTLARCMVGTDENSAKDCGIVVDAMTQLLTATPRRRGVVLGVHHAGKDGKTLRGSSAFQGAADTVYLTTKDGAVINLDREKRKDGPQEDRHALKIDPMPGTNSATLSRHRGGAQPESADRLLAVFVDHFTATGASKADLRAVAGMPSATFSRALSLLVKGGDLVNNGTEQRPFYRAADE